jgi:hypothetical protein
MIYNILRTKERATQPIYFRIITFTIPCKLCFYLLYTEKIRQFEYFTDIILTRKPTDGQPKHIYIYITLSKMIRCLQMKTKSSFEQLRVVVV